MIFKENISSYNDSFIVPKKGIFELIKKFCIESNIIKILYNMKIVKIDIDKKIIFFNDNTKIEYDILVNTSPHVFLNLINKR